MWKWEVGRRNVEVGRRPPASPSCRLYPPGRSRLPLRDGVEPEAIGAKGAYAPEGRWIKKLTRNKGIGRHDDGVVRFKILLLTISSEYVKYDYHIMQGD